MIIASDLVCAGCQEPIEDLGKATAALPDINNTGVIDPLHMNPYCGAVYQQKRGSPYLWLVPDSIRYFVAENVRLAAAYPGGSFAKTEKGIGHKTLKSAIVEAARRTADLYKKAV